MDYCGPRGIALTEFLRWSQRDQDAALAWTSYEARRCRGCGTHPDEWADDPRAYHAHLSEQCPGCLASHRLTERHKDGLEPGVRVVLPQIPATACPQCRPT
jgi:hypothetical protein